MVTAQQSAALGLAVIRLPPLSILDNLKARPPGGSHAVELPLRGTLRAEHQQRIRHAVAGGSG